MAGNYLGYAPIKSEGKSIHPACMHTCDRLGGIAEIERLQECMNTAMNHCLLYWHKNGCKEDDQLGVVALLLADGLGKIQKQQGGGE